MNELVEKLKSSKNNYIFDSIEYINKQFPNRTTEIDKCYRDLSYVIDYFINAIANEEDIRESAVVIGSKFWHRGERQIVHTEVEFRVYDYLADLVSDDIPSLSYEILDFVDALKLALNKGPYLKEPNIRNTDTTEQLFVLANNRHNWKPLEGNKPSKEDLEIILNAASGLTPALSNEYNYRVDEVPDYLKQTVYNSIIQWSKSALESGNPGYAKDRNEQLLAPLVLCFSLRYNRENKLLYQMSGDMTERDANIINLGFCAWHTILTAESLGYKTGICQFSGWKREKVKDVLGLYSDEPQSDYLTERNGECTFMPMLMVCIGTSGRVNKNTRLIKKENIVNRLKFNTQETLDA